MVCTYRADTCAKVCRASSGQGKPGKVKFLPGQRKVRECCFWSGKNLNFGNVRERSRNFEFFMAPIGKLTWISVKLNLSDLMD